MSKEEGNDQSRSLLHAKKFNIRANLCSILDLFEFCFVGNPEYRFVSLQCPYYMYIHWHPEEETQASTRCINIRLETEFPNS